MKTEKNLTCGVLFGPENKKQRCTLEAGHPAVRNGYGHFCAPEKGMMHDPAHPGTILKGEIEALNVTITAFAEHIGVSRNTLTNILAGRAGVTADMSIRLAQAFGQESPDFWFRIQNDYDFWQATQVKRTPVARIPAGMKVA